MTQAVDETIEPAVQPPPHRTRALTWSMVVCTYRREKILPRCIRCALASERRPAQVVVVDSSPYWQTTRSELLEEFESSHRDVEFIYLGARRASSTTQRNQGLEATRADVAFLIDDDSLLYPDAASRIMEVYDADPRGEVVALTPIFVPQPPDAGERIEDPLGARGHVPHDEERASWLRRMARELLWSEMQLLPYDDREHIAPVPRRLQQFDLIPTRFASGSATFRTQTIREIGFEEALERYAAGEDWDVSERLKYRGLIAYMPTARQCHLEAPGGRLSRRTVCTLRYLNFMALHILHSTDVRRSRRLYRQMLWRRVLSDGLSDLVKGNFGLPRARGTWDALRMLPQMFSRSAREIRQWYPARQREIIARDRGEERAR